MSDLADALFCDSSNVTGIVDRLEERGLVRRQSSKGIAASSCSSSPGREWMRERDHQADGRAAAAPIASLSEKDQRELRDILKRAVESISEDAEEENNSVADGFAIKSRRQAAASR